MAGDIEQNNGKVTLAVIKVQLDQALLLLKELRDNAATDHEKLIRLEEQIQDFILLKRAVWIYGIGIVASLSLALYSVIQHGVP